MEEAKPSAHPRMGIAGLPAHKARMWLISRKLRHGQARHFSLPPDLSSVGGILVVAPEERLDAITAAHFLVSIRQSAPRARIVLVCEKSVAGCFSDVEGLSEVLTYDDATPRLFASGMRNLARAVGVESFDLCLLLQARPHGALVYLACQTQAPLRIGYAGAAPFPFLNVRIRETSHPGVLSSVRQVLGFEHEPEAA